jgi:Domain of unknown function (DUF4388)
VRLKLVTGADGEVALPASEAKAARLEGATDWRALPGLGLLSQVGAAGAWFAGTLAAASFAEVAQLVASTLKTGVLHLSLGAGGARHRKTVHFRDGGVSFASSSDPADRLGPVLERLGLASAEDVGRCGPLVGPGRPLGQVLVEQGVLDAGRLYEGIAGQVREIFLSAFEAEEGEFLFREQPLDQGTAVRLPERTRDLILAGLKRADEAEQLRRPPVPDLPAPEWPEAAPEAPATSGRPPPRRATASAPPATSPASAVGLSGAFDAYRRLFRAVHGAAARASSEAGRQLESWFERAPPSLRGPFAGADFGPDGSVDMDRVFANAMAKAPGGPTARARALEALEALLAFALFEACNRLSRDEAEALRREVRRVQLGE